MEVASGPPRERYRCLREKVLALVRGYNEILSQLTPQERRLFSERLVFLDRKIGPGLSKLTWNAKAQLDVYLKETKRHCADASKLVSAFHGNKALLAKSCRQVHVSSRQDCSSPAAHASAHRGASAPAARSRARPSSHPPRMQVLTAAPPLLPPDRELAPRLTRRACKCSPRRLRSCRQIASSPLVSLRKKHVYPQELFISEQSAHQGSVKGKLQDVHKQMKALMRSTHEIFKSDSDEVRSRADFICLGLRLDSV